MKLRLSILSIFAFQLILLSNPSYSTSSILERQGIKGTDEKNEEYVCKNERRYNLKVLNILGNYIDEMDTGHEDPLLSMDDIKVIKAQITDLKQKLKIRPFKKIICFLTFGKKNSCKKASNDTSDDDIKNLLEILEKTGLHIEKTPVKRPRFLNCQFFWNGLFNTRKNTWNNNKKTFKCTPVIKRKMPIKGIELTEKLKKSSEEFSTLQKSYETLEKNNQEHNDKLNKEIEVLKSKMGDLRKVNLQIEDVKGRFAHEIDKLKGREKEIQKQHNLQKQKVQEKLERELQDSKSKLALKIEELNKAHQEALKENASFEKEIDKLRLETSELKRINLEFQGQSSDLQKRLDEARAELKSKRDELKQVDLKSKSTRKELQDEIDRLQSHTKLLETQKISKENESEQLKTKNSRLYTRVTNLVRRSQQSQAENDQIRRENDRLKSEAKRLETNIRDLNRPTGQIEILRDELNQQSDRLKDRSNQLRQQKDKLDREQAIVDQVESLRRLYMDSELKSEEIKDYFFPRNDEKEKELEKSDIQDKKEADKNSVALSRNKNARRFTTENITVVNLTPYPIQYDLERYEGKIDLTAQNIVLGTGEKRKHTVENVGFFARKWNTPWAWESTRSEKYKITVSKNIGVPWVNRKQKVMDNFYLNSVEAHGVSFEFGLGLDNNLVTRIFERVQSDLMEKLNNNTLDIRKLTQDYNLNKHQADKLQKEIKVNIDKSRGKKENNSFAGRLIRYMIPSKSKNKSILSLREPLISTFSTLGSLLPEKPVGKLFKTIGNVSIDKLFNNSQIDTLEGYKTMREFEKLLNSEGGLLNEILRNGFIELCNEYISAHGENWSNELMKDHNELMTSFIIPNANIKISQEAFEKLGDEYKSDFRTYLNTNYGKNDHKETYSIDGSLLKDTEKELYLVIENNKENTESGNIFTIKLLNHLDHEFNITNEDIMKRDRTKR